MSQTITVSDKKNLLDHSSVTFEEREADLAALKKREEIIRKKEIGSPFSRWTQFNLEHTEELIRLAIKHPKAHAILYFLVDQMDEHNAVMCSYQVLQEVLGISKPTITRSVKVLKEAGFLAVLKSGTSNVYAINDSVYWKSWGNKKKYSKFPANVVLSMTEQDEDYKKNFETDKLKSVSLKETE